LFVSLCCLRGEVKDKNIDVPECLVLILGGGREARLLCFLCREVNWILALPESMD